MLRTIKIKFQNGITFKGASTEIFAELSNDFVFEESPDPDFILFGPYGNDLPPPGDYIRIGYYCENIKPDLTICEWAFGVPRESEVKHPKYKRIQWHNLDPKNLIKPSDLNINSIINSKTKFCNFLYGHKVPYREKFFKQLSKYKKIDAPGASMNNLPAIDPDFEGDIWARKKQFLSSYKFTIAFENYSYPGYQTEKLYNAMECDSIPLYCGDPFISEIFNTKSFIDASDIMGAKYGSSIKLLEKKAQSDFIDIRPMYYHKLNHRFRRKIKAYGRELKMKMQYNQLNFEKLVDKIVEIDEDDNLYAKMISEPWLNNNVPPPEYSSRERWLTIFNTKW